MELFKKCQESEKAFYDAIGKGNSAGGLSAIAGLAIGITAFATLIASDVL
jgi:hypothetical protein